MTTPDNHAVFFSKLAIDESFNFIGGRTPCVKISSNQYRVEVKLRDRKDTPAFRCDLTDLVCKRYSVKDVLDALT